MQPQESRQPSEADSAQSAVAAAAAVIPRRPQVCLLRKHGRCLPPSLPALLERLSPFSLASTSRGKTHGRREQIRTLTPSSTAVAVRARCTSFCSWIRPGGSLRRKQTDGSTAWAALEALTTPTYTKAATEESICTAGWLRWARCLPPPHHSRLTFLPLKMRPFRRPVCHSPLPYFLRRMQGAPSSRLRAHCCVRSTWIGVRSGGAAQSMAACGSTTA